MAGGGGLQITLSGEAAEQLRGALPKHAALDKAAEKILLDWVHDRAVARAVKRLEKISKQPFRPWREIRTELEKLL